MTRLFLSLAMIACMSFLAAQSSFSKENLSPCGVTQRGEWIDAYQRGEIAAVRSDDTLVLPLRIHIVRRTDGTGGISVEDVLETMELVNFDFATANITFYIDGEIEFLNNDNWYNHNSAFGGQMMQTNNDNGVINCYFVGNPNGACGYYSFPPNDALAISNSCTGANDRTWSHEMGHFLSLPHTFSGWEFYYSENNRPLNYHANVNAPLSVGGRFTELADGSNCAFSGDGFCDTPADYLSDRWACSGGGTFGQDLLDKDGNALSVQAFPIMGYALDNCVSSFTDEQRTAMNTNVASRGNLARDIPIEYTAADPADMNLVFPTDGELVYTPNELEVTLDWDDVPNADMYLIQLAYNPVFAGVREFMAYGESELALNEAEHGLIINQLNAWRVRPINRFNVDGAMSEQEFTFRLVETSSTQDPELAGAIAIYPNPVKAGENSINITASGLSDNGAIQLELINTSGQAVINKSNLNVVNGNFRHELSLAGLPTGVYFARIRQNDRLLTRRVVVSK